MPSSVSEGTRPRAARMRLYSFAVMPCVESNCGVTATGEGTTAEEALVITDASIVAWDSHLGECGKRGRIRIVPFRSRLSGEPGPRACQRARCLQALEIGADLGAGPVLRADELAPDDALAVDDVGLGPGLGVVEFGRGLGGVADRNQVHVAAGEGALVRSE